MPFVSYRCPDCGAVGDAFLSRGEELCKGKKAHIKQFHVKNSINIDFARCKGENVKFEIKEKSPKNNFELSKNQRLYLKEKIIAENYHTTNKIKLC